MAPVVGDCDPRCCIEANLGGSIVGKRVAETMKWVQLEVEKSECSFEKMM